jgi:hypothetical protein
MEAPATPRYGISLRTCKNFLPTVHGALLNRAGTTLLGLIVSASLRGRRFIFSDGQALVLEFTNLSVRFWTVDGLVEVAGVPYAVATPYVAADLTRLDFAQAGDVITITHPSYQTRELIRVSNSSWTIALVTLTTPAAFIPQGLVISERAADNAPAYNALTTYAPGQYVNDGAATFICLLTTTGNAPPASAGVLSAILFTRYWALALDFEHIAKEWSVVVTARYKDAFGIERETLASVAAGMTACITTDRPAKYAWTAPPDPGFFYKLTGYSVYRGRNGLWGWLDDTDAGTITFKDDGRAPDYGIQPPRGTNPFKVADGVNTEATTKWPGAVTYHEQRRVFARTDVRPDYFFGSWLGDIQRFDVNDPATEENAYDWRVSSQQLEEIRAVRSFGRLVIFTGQGEFSAQGPDGKGISELGVEVRRHSTHGSSYVPPLEVEHALLFNTAKGNHVRDFFFDYNSNAYVGVDVSEFARHFFRGYTITWWAHQRVPHHLVWVGRSDGTLFSLTYDRATQTIAWAQHETNGTVLWGECIPGGTEDVLLLAVQRNGSVYMEKMASRDYIPDVRLAIFLDSALSVDGRNTDGTLTMRVTGASGYDAAALVTVLASAASFAVTDVGDQVVICPDGIPAVLDADGAVVTPEVPPTRITVTAFTDATHVTGRLEAPLPAVFQNAVTASWGWARDTLSGLDHLEGMDVTVLGDGVVDGPFTVQAGAIGPLARPALIATAGLAYTSDAELLDLAHESVKTNVKALVAATFEVVASRGVYAGEDFDNLRPAKLREVADDFETPALVTDQVTVKTDSSWNTGGRACIRQSDPLPLTITAALREIEVGGRG